MSSSGAESLASLEKVAAKVAREALLGQKELEKFGRLAGEQDEKTGVEPEYDNDTEVDATILRKPLSFLKEKN